MVMRETSSNNLDTVISKQQYETKYYLCSALLDYGIIFYKREHLKLKNIDSVTIKNWLDNSLNLSGKISWIKSDKTVQIKAELLKSNNPEFSMQATLSFDINDQIVSGAKILNYEF